MSFLEGLGFPGQNCDDRRWLHAFLHDASDCPFGPSGDDYGKNINKKNNPWEL